MVNLILDSDIEMASFPVLPVYGPLEIENLQDFLNASKKNVEKIFSEKIETENHIQLEELERIKTIGIGSFGTVLQVKDSENNYYALKAIDKKYLVKTKQVNHILNEKKILSVMNFPFTVHLISYLSDNSYLYFLLPFISGGDLFSLLKKFGRLDEGLARFYSAQITLALEYLHFIDIIYRDLKPENVLIDHNGYIKLTDFGFGKYLKSRTWTLCGTPEYLAPEIILNQGYSKSVDWWAFGVIVFELVSGRSPFYAKDSLKIYEKILALRYVFSPDVSTECRSLVNHLLKPNISQRFGSLKNGVTDIKQHLWFRPIEWQAVLNRRLEPPYVPANREVEANFEPCRDVILKISETNRFEKHFENF